MKGSAGGLNGHTEAVSEFDSDEFRKARVTELSTIDLDARDLGAHPEAAAHGAAASASTASTGLQPLSPVDQRGVDLAGDLAGDGGLSPRTLARRATGATDDFKLICVIGMGAFGKVLQVRNKVDGRLYAMKVISKKLLRRKNSVENMRAERDILTKVGPHVGG